MSKILSTIGALWIGLMSLIGINQQNVGFSVVTAYQKTLKSPMTSSQTTVPVSSLQLKDGTTLTMDSLGNQVFLDIEPGGSREEIVMCTDINSSTPSFTGCIRGLAFSGTSTVAVGGNAYSHNAGAVVVMSNVHYVYDQYVDVNNKNQTIGGIKTFTTFPVVSSTSFTGLVTQNGQLATKFYVDNVGATGMTAANVSTTQGARVFGTAPETLGVNVSTTKGMTIGTDGAIYQKASSTVGILQDSNGMYLDTNFVVFDSDTTSTPTANKIPIANSSGVLPITWIATSTSNGQYLKSTSTGLFFGAIGSTSTLPSRSFGVTYQNTSTQSLFITVSSALSETNTAGASATIYAFVDASSTPTNLVAEAGWSIGSYSGFSPTIPVSFIVAPGNYYEVVASLTGVGTATLVNWSEMKL